MSDPYAYDQAFRAVTFALEVFRPPGKVALPVRNYGLPEETWRRLGEGFARQLLADVQSRSNNNADSTIVEAIRERLGRQVSKLRIPADTPIVSSGEKRRR